MHIWKQEYTSIVYKSCVRSSRSWGREAYSDPFECMKCMKRTGITTIVPSGIPPSIPLLPQFAVLNGRPVEVKIMKICECISWKRRKYLKKLQFVAAEFRWTDRRHSYPNVHINLEVAIGGDQNVSFEKVKKQIF